MGERGRLPERSRGLSDSLDCQGNSLLLVHGFTLSSNVSCSQWIFQEQREEEVVFNSLSKFNSIFNLFSSFKNKYVHTINHSLGVRRVVRASPSAG
jgi:hypothetical protein